MTVAGLRRLRLRAHLLDRPQSNIPADGSVGTNRHLSLAHRDVAELVGRLGAVQAQLPSAANLAIRARSTGLAASDIEHTRVIERSVIRTWALRGTLHLVAAEDLDWLLPLLGPIFLRANRARRLQLGLDDETCALGVAALRNLLASRGPQTRGEIRAALAPLGFALAGQAAPHLLYYAALEGVICLGPDREDEPTYVLLADWRKPGAALGEEQSRAELARRYLAAYGPAAPEDFIAWSGLPSGSAREGWKRIAQEPVEVAAAGRTLWMLEENAGWLDELDESASSVHLLPNFDAYLLGYRDRAFALDPRHAGRVNAGGGMIRPVLLVDGRVAGTWSSKRRGRRMEIVVAPFDNLDPSVLPGLEAEAADVGRFLGMTATLRGSAPLSS